MSEELEIIEPDVVLRPVNLFGANDPLEVVAKSTEVATALTDVIKKQALFKQIGDKPHVLVEGWTLLGSMLGVFPIVVWTHRLENPDGWEARVEARTLSGDVVGAAEAECLRSESRWSSRDDYALRSMAQTRATSKALRGPLGFIVHLAGFSATPAEEIAPETPADGPQLASKGQKALIGIWIRALQDGGEIKPHEGDAFAVEAQDPPPPFESWKEYAKNYTLEQYGKGSSTQLTPSEAGRLIDHLEHMSVPFG